MNAILEDFFFLRFKDFQEFFFFSIFFANRDVRHETLEMVIEKILLSIRGQYVVPLSQMLHDILRFNIHNDNLLQSDFKANP